MKTPSLKPSKRDLASIARLVKKFYRGDLELELNKDERKTICEEETENWLISHHPDAGSLVICKLGEGEDWEIRTKKTRRLRRRLQVNFNLVTREAWAFELSVSLRGGKAVVVNETEISLPGIEVERPPIIPTDGDLAFIATTIQLILDGKIDLTDAEEGFLCEDETAGSFGFIYHKGKIYVRKFDDGWRRYGRDGNLSAMLCEIEFDPKSPEKTCKGYSATFDGGKSASTSCVFSFPPSVSPPEIKGTKILLKKKSRFGFIYRSRSLFSPELFVVRIQDGGLTISLPDGDWAISLMPFLINSPLKKIWEREEEKFYLVATGCRIQIDPFPPIFPVQDVEDWIYQNRSELESATRLLKSTYIQE